MAGGHYHAGHKISEKYTLGEELGRGGFGTVFACRNSETGETVAVKRIDLRNLSKESLNLIEQEVSLLKKLDHPNIVKYIDTLRANDHLHIVLEFMENGSLARNLKLFGTLSQSLCALYIRQVLNGLAYLHDQGVIHRDIKGANILTTKSGLVKLADFGVATHSSAQSNEVVGTPYWMAPEIIEMSGPTTACDIWSVGCTIIELLTLKPPYFDIPPMAALYRIVQDEHPPLPEGLSPALQEFLVLCFKKEPLLRSSAKDLLRHRWVHKPRGIHEPKFVRADGVQEDIQDSIDSGEEEDLTPGLSEKKDELEEPRRRRSSTDHSQRKEKSKSLQSRQSLRKRSSLVDDENLYAIREHTSSPLDDDESGVRPDQVSEKQRTLWRRSVMNTIRLTIRLSEEQRKAGLKAQKEMDDKRDRRKGKDSSEGDEDGEEEEEEEDWDEWDQDNFQAAQEARKRKQKLKRLSKGKMDDTEGEYDGEGEDEGTMDDNDDEFDDDEEEDFGFGEADESLQSEHGKQIQAQFRAMLGSRANASMKKGLPNAPKLSVGELDLEDIEGAFDEDVNVKTLTSEHIPSTENAKLESKLARFKESEEGDDGFLEMDDEKNQSTADGEQDVLEVLKKRMMAVSNLDESQLSGSSAKNKALKSPREDYSDPFLDEFEDSEDDSDVDFVEDAGRSLVAQQTQQVEKLISMLRPDKDDETVLNACAKLTTLFREQPAQRRTLLTHHGVIPIMEMLEMSNTDVLHAVLKVVGQIIENDREFQELLSLAGLIPIVAKFCRPSVSRPIRLQAASLVKQFLKTSTVTLQMLVACGGLPILAGLLVPCVDPGQSSTSPQHLDKEDECQGGAESSPPSGQMEFAEFLRQESPPDVALGCVAVDGIKRVFELSSLGSGRGTIPKNDFCRLFAKEGVLRQLVALLEHCRTPQGETECAVLGFQACTLVQEIAEVLLVFSHGDSIVKQHFADHSVLEGMLRFLTLEAPFHATENSSAKVGRGSSSRRSIQTRSTGKSSVAEGPETTMSGNVALDEEEIGPLIKTLLKCIKNLCMEPSTLETLESAGAIPTLVPFLAYCSNMSKLSNSQAESGDAQLKRRAKRAGGQASLQRSNSFVPGKQLSAAQEQLIKEIQNLVMLAMFYLCRLSRSRQEQAAVSGIIPFLMDAIATRSPVKTFALQILTDFAHTSDLTRDQLWRCDALDFYLDLLVSGDVFWQEKAFTSLSAWLSNATPEVERAMLRPRSLQRLVGLFQSAQSSNFENYVKELLVMLTRSHKLCEAIGRSGLFMSELVARLSFPKAEVRINLLKMVKIIGEQHQDLEHLILEHNLFAVVTNLAKQAEDAHRVLVMEIANQLLDEWNDVLFPQ